MDTLNVHTERCEVANQTITCHEQDPVLRQGWPVVFLVDEKFD